MEDESQYFGCNAEIVDHMIINWGLKESITTGFSLAASSEPFRNIHAT